MQVLSPVHFIRRGFPSALPAALGDGVGILASLCFDELPLRFLDTFRSGWTEGCRKDGLSETFSLTKIVGNARKMIQSGRSAAW